ncbi:MAG: tRNA (N6-threonylcarbamoyladenosine(37)-N6)-methyltransferase TrmO [Planctomycetes bacterium]|nr:tRNA (N6-threonylcarbamoyladenosine(37)-N6)-methyltransferase TrmO [Planctomycetota bacterium]
MTYNDKIELFPIGFLHTPFDTDAPFKPDIPKENCGEFWIELDEKYIPSLDKLQFFNYIYVLFYLDRIADTVKLKAHPPSYGRKEVGLFASRSPYRPNHIALSAVRLLKIERNLLFISSIDALNNSPVLDIKPYFKDLDCKEDANSGWRNNLENK